MEYTEEIKKEADSIIEQYLPIVLDYPNVAINCAIQDRQSVLDNNQKLIAKLINSRTKLAIIFVSQEIQSLTQQIDYLKSKL